MRGFSGPPNGKTQLARHITREIRRMKGQELMESLLDRPETNLAREPVSASIVFTGAGTKQPALLFTNVDPLQVLTGLELIEAGALKIERAESSAPGRGTFELFALSADEPITVATAYGLSPTQRRAAIILLRLWAEQMANRFIAAMMVPPSPAPSSLLIPRH